MSLILDALRKMELERKAKRQSSAEVRAEVLNYRASPHAVEKSRLLPYLAGLLLVAAAVAIFFYVDHSATTPAKAVKLTVPATAASKTQPILPVTEPLPQAALPERTRPAEAAKSPAAANQPVAAPTTPQKAGDDHFTVSGIAWQEDRSLRRAVINNALVGEGALILGARVIEIRENLVRFSRDGYDFEVRYPSGSTR